MDKSKMENNIEKNKSVSKEILEWFESLCVALFVVILVFTFILKQVSVYGASMEPTLTGYSESNSSQIGDRLIINRFLYEPEINDIVVVKAQNLNGGENIIKRVIATEGQKVDIDFEEGTVSVDGEIRNEPFIKEITKYEPQGGFEYPVEVPDECVFVLGDNRNNSTDSRDPLVGMVNKKDIMGKAILRIFPLDRMSTLK